MRLIAAAADCNSDLAVAAADRVNSAAAGKVTTADCDKENLDLYWDS